MVEGWKDGMIPGVEFILPNNRNGIMEYWNDAISE
jgi:hypothetical protein